MITQQLLGGYEVGVAHEGHPTPEQKVAELQRYLDTFGSDPEAWLSPPEILEQHVSVSVDFFRRGGPLMVTPSNGCHWAVYGVLKERPEHDEYTPEGVRIKTTAVLVGR